MLTLPNVATADKYTDACTLGPVATTQQIVFVVANAAVLAQIAPLHANGTVGDWEQDEILLTPQSNTLQRAGGIRFRSAVAGVSAQIVAQLITPADPVPGAGTPFTARLAGSGGVTPGSAAVQVQKDGALIGTEPILDLIGGFVVADDAANTRVTITTPRLTVGLYTGGPPAAPVDGDLWLATSVDTGVAGTGTVDWLFKYRAATARWHFVGGPPMLTQATGLAVTIPNSAWAAITAVRFTSVRAGRFNARATMRCSTNGSPPTTSLVYASINSGLGLAPYFEILGGTVAGWGIYFGDVETNVDLGAGGTIDVCGDSNLSGGVTCSADGATLAVTPVYIT